MDIPSILNVQSFEQAMDDTFVLESQSIEHVEVNTLKEGRVENDAGVGEVDKIGKVEIPLAPIKEGVAK